MFRPHTTSEAKGGNTFSSSSGDDFFDSKFEDDDDDDGGGGGGMIMIDIDGAADSKTLDHYLAGNDYESADTTPPLPFPQISSIPTIPWL